MDHLSPAGCRWHSCLATQEAALYARPLRLSLAGIVAGGIAAGFIFLAAWRMEEHARSLGGTARPRQLCLDTGMHPTRGIVSERS